MNKKTKTLIFVKAMLVGLCLLSPQVSTAQERVVLKGIVTSSEGEVLPGATIKIQGSSKGAISDIDGKFTLDVKKGQKIVVSFIGMKTKTIRINSSIIDVVLDEYIDMMDEVVITGYQNIKNRVFTGASALVRAADIKMDGVPDITRMLEGRVAGLSIQDVNGVFGSAPRINIRGGASIMGNVQPLWVVDGCVYEDLVSLTLDQIASGDAVTLISSAMAGLNAADIEDIQVLKDASATSIYGARALNGVIVVTTRSGRRNSQNRVNYAYELSFRNKPSYANFDLLDSQESMAIFMEMEKKGYFSLQDALYGRRGGAFHQMYSAMSRINPHTGNYFLPNTFEAKKSFLTEREYANTDWFEELFTHKPVQTHTLSFNGGGENSATYASVGYYNDGGWTVSDNVKRFTANLRSTFFWKDKFRATFTMQGNMRKQKSPGTMPQRKNTTLGTFERDFDINPFSYALGTSRTLRPRNVAGELEYYRNNWAPFNILNEYQNNYMYTDVLGLKLQGDLSYRISKQLELKGLVALRHENSRNSHYIHENSNVVQAFRAHETPFVARENIYLLRNQENDLLQPEVVLQHGGIFNKTEISMKSYVGRVALDYNFQKGEHDVRAFGFTEIRSTEREVNPFQGFGIQYDRGNQIFSNPMLFEKLGKEKTPYFGLTKMKDRGVTFSGSATYGYAGRYVFNAVVNYEGSNAAGKGRGSRWLPTWNAGVKWNIDREEFMEKFNNISRLAVRASYGLTAKMNENAVNSNAVFQNVVINRPNTKVSEHGLDIKHLENRDLTWEKMYELNLGLELGLLNNRISTTLDLYQRSSFDLIDLVRTSGIGGQYYKYANFGDMRTRGIELAVNTKNIQGGKFNWSTTLTLSAMNQKITKLLNTPNAFEMVSGTGMGNIVGFPRGSLFSFNFQGLNENGMPTFDFGQYPSNKNKINEIAGADFTDSQYIKSYLIYEGSTEPKIMGGLSNVFNWGNWELSFFITIQAGNKIRLNPTFDPTFADLNVFSKDYYDRWLNPGDELRTQVPALPSQKIISLYGKENVMKAFNTYNYSQVRVADGSFVRMKNISIAYAFPTKWTNRFFVKNLSLRFNATNPFLIYADKKLNGQDPEYYRSGGVSLPAPQQYTFTVNVGL